MKIYHVTTFAVSPEIRQHIINIVNLENAMGYNSQWEQSSADFLSEGRKTCDFVHIHGFPVAEYAIKTMTLIKNLKLNKIKFVVSMYDYSAICRTSIMRSSCSPSSCPNKDCQKSRGVFAFLKEVPIFVYSEVSKQIFSDNGFQDIVLQPVNYYGALENFPVPNYDDEVTNRVGIFNINSLFDLEMSFYNKIKQEPGLRVYTLDYFKKFETNFVLDYKKWPSSFPIETGYSLAHGVPVIANTKYASREYNGMGLNLFDLDDEEHYRKAVDMMKSNQSFEIHRLIAHDFWKHHGPDKCVAWYEASYRDLLK